MDEFQSCTKGLTSPGTTHVVITPDDGADLPILPRVIYCQGEGTIIVRDSDGTDLPYTMAEGDRLACARNRGHRYLLRLVLMLGAGLIGAAVSGSGRRHKN